ncbi:hypothetical protein H3Z83_10425 [Tenacibaculum sp. S7007]|uniref:Uncharacterized protein n=1 Tax=Tenacibaculum pelagium TaxID=2759527 RepID=A0A839APC2_9FLAO|nr:hypothetical protein [Tenacibaculum pelagium]MBA6156932.1 hypothetical protein [Tenacibaculum pelagium]
MHKKLASDLTSLAHSILQMKNKEDVFELKQKAYEVYEKLSVLAYVEEYINNTPNPSKTKNELLQDILLAEENRIEKNKIEEPIVEEVKVVHQLDDLEEAIELEAEDIADDVINEIIEEEIDLKVVEEITEQPFDELESLIFENSDDVKSDVKDVGDKKTPTLEDELQDTISVDVMADLFEKVESKKSLNDKLQNSIQIGLNDRIAFVKHLFNGDQNDFNRVVSQLNTFKTEKEAKKFINKMIKPDYNWTEKEEYETRLFEIIERRFA